MAGSVWAVVVAAGQGVRFGGAKQFATIGGRSVLERAVASVAPVSDGVVVVLPPEAAPTVSGPPGVVATAGRATRAGSVRAGLELVPEECEVVLVHDAARPLATPLLAARVVEAVRAGADGAVPALVLADTVKLVAEGRVERTLERNRLVRVQTPQAFSAAVLRRAHEGEPEATDDAGLVEALGGTVAVVDGEESNVKITTPADLELAHFWFQRLSVANEGTPE